MSHVGSATQSHRRHSSDALPVHFWVPFDPDRGFDSWIPDLDPNRYLSGTSHGVLELYKRLEKRGRPVTIGPIPPRRSHIVFHLESVWRWSSESPYVSLLRRLLVQLVNHGVGTAIRGDIPFKFSVRIEGVIEVMPNRSSIGREAQVWLPLLPQRGLIRRSDTRLGAVRSVALLGFGPNIPAYFRSVEFAGALARLGMTVTERIAEGPGEDPRWHDFRGIDCVLCLRADAVGADLLRKPATRLINAWAAGAIPIIGREPAYVELACPGQDSLLVETVEEVVPMLERLRAQEGLVARLEEGGRRRAREFSTERILDQWEAFLLTRRATERSALAAAQAANLWLDAGIRRIAGGVRRRAGAYVRRARTPLARAVPVTSGWLRR